VAVACSVAAVACSVAVVETLLPLLPLLLASTSRNLLCLRLLFVSAQICLGSNPLLLRPDPTLLHVLQVRIS
jgi:hypothetical protein